MRRTKPTIIDLRSLSEEEGQFWQKAKKYFRRNTNWRVFENFAFGPNSPVYKGKRRRIEVEKDVLFQALVELLLRLGVKQGKVAKEKTGQAVKFLE